MRRSPQAIAAALRARDVPLHPGRPDFDADGLAALGLGQLHADFVAMVRCFDGFVHNDDGYIRMWEVATILAEHGASPKPPGMVAFGDVLVFSDVILCDPCDPLRPVIYAFEERKLAPSYAAFWDKLTAGDFDVPPLRTRR